VRCELLGTASESALRVTSDWPSKGKRIGRPTISRRLRERRPKIFSGTPIGIVRRECLDRLLIFGESPPPAPQWQKSVIIMLRFHSSLEGLTDKGALCSGNSVSSFIQTRLGHQT
jgi:hypothetical protein